MVKLCEDGEREKAFNEGLGIGKKLGYSSGLDEGRQMGYNEGLEEGKEVGHSSGLEEGRAEKEELRRKKRTAWACSRVARERRSDPNARGSHVFTEGATKDIT